MKLLTDKQVLPLLCYVWTDEHNMISTNAMIHNIGIKRIDFCNDLRSNELSLNLNKKELHSFIGTLLHVQQKMKGSV